MDVNSKVPTNCKIFLKIMGYVDEILMIFFLAVYEFYRIHKNIGMLLQKIATNTFSAVGCLLYLSSFRQKSILLSQGSKNCQDILIRWAMLLIPHPGYTVDY